MSVIPAVYKVIFFLSYKKNDLDIPSLLSSFLNTGLVIFSLLSKN